MPSPRTTDRHSDSATGWLIIAGLLGLGILAKIIELLAGQVANQGPSGAYTLLGLGVAACAAFGALVVGPIGRAIGKRILQGPAGPAASDEDVQELRAQVDELRGALVDAQERIDFAERMLAGGKEPHPEELH